MSTRLLVMPRFTATLSSPRMRGSSGIAKFLSSRHWIPAFAGKTQSGLCHVMLVVLTLGVPLFTFADAPPLPALNGEVITAKTADGIEYGLWGTKVTYPAPTLFIFASDIKATLDNPYFRQCGDALAEQGYLCVSLDLPGHGADQRDGEPGSLGTWRTRSDDGEDFIAPFTARVRAVLDHLISIGATDPARVAACGTSRGGFMALQVAAADPRIRATAAFAPVTNLMALREFTGAKNTEHVAKLSLLANAEKFAGRSLWLVIGDRDDRVSTDDAIAFARRVTTISLEKNSAADVTFLVLPEPKGHTTPKGAPELAAAWLAETLK